MSYPSGNDFLRESVLSATPAQLVTMLYDRLLLDLARAEAAQASGDWSTASVNLLHAQDIVAELSSSLDVDAWAGGPHLLAIYTYLTTQLIAANVHRDIERTRECASLLGPLRWAWLAAAQSLSGGGETGGGASIAVVA